MTTTLENQSSAPVRNDRTSERILCVDDEPKVLAVYQRMLQGQFDIQIAEGPEKGLAAVNEFGPFAVVVSDMRMPGMNGAQFLGCVRDLAPNSVRMLLTGYADQQSAIEAINEGNVFRFLSKPCSKDDFVKALKSGVEQYRLILSEKELLEGTLRGSIQVLTELLALVNPLAFGRTERVKRTMQHLARLLNVENAWQFEVAGLLSQIGCITLSELLLTKIALGEALTNREQSQIDSLPRIAANLIQKIPRLSDVAEIIAFQEKHFDGSGTPHDGRSGNEIPVGARALMAVLDFEHLQAKGQLKTAALAAMRLREGWYDSTILDAIERIPSDWAGYTAESLPVHALREGMILDENLQLPNGLVLARQGFELTEVALLRLADQFSAGNIKGLICVLVPPVNQ
jgi:response regulator RpfG family c-di-GMP phosphodiesterase